MLKMMMRSLNLNMNQGIQTFWQALKEKKGTDKGDEEEKEGSDGGDGGGAQQRRETTFPKTICSVLSQSDEVDGEDRRKIRSAVTEEKIGGRMVEEKSANDRRREDRRMIDGRPFYSSVARASMAGRTSPAGTTGFPGFNGFQRAIHLNGLKPSTGPFSGPGPVQSVQPAGPGRVQKHWSALV
ncbi:hypothetical protein SLEP1_g23494 [Rubroshorea leprosula]|uniref:Uncharacterized protein n=1 Tax=Rubroshorea leprosula TaxID=152421 RepID=A0AAV5JM31_9ROSI|nr:hypothetical protein SLEP1_g23494 [Rubroshorea leprosula]